MRTLGFSLFLLLFAGCATVSAPPPLTAADVVTLSKEGRSPNEIIAELRRTSTVIPLRASDYVALHEAGVQKDVLDYLQYVQIEDMRSRDRSLYMYGPGWGYGYGGFGPCRYRGRWGC